MVKDLEKRLQLLRRQVYGGQQVSGIRYQVSRDEETSVITHNTKYIIQNTDTHYLHQDLLKILILASLAIGAQVILFILSQNHILNLNLL